MRPGRAAGCHLEGALEVDVVARDGRLLPAALSRHADDLVDLLERHGKLPLPPYIERRRNASDEARYQTVYARAGLRRRAHRRPAFRRGPAGPCAPQGVNTAWLTLHVGAGTFQPVRVDDLPSTACTRER
jgi:S-adenosylmethionine:tRNA ribosyltransferase-isomerase